MDPTERGYWHNGEWKGTLVVSTLAASIPFGLFMGFYTENFNWFYFCIPMFIFLS